MNGYGIEAIRDGIHVTGHEVSPDKEYDEIVTCFDKVRTGVL
jgi:hypothetical protein